MQDQSSLFYDKQYSSLINNLNKSPQQSIQKSHNITIAKFLNNQSNPLSELEEIEKKIKNESIIHNSWPLHSSWPLIQYHKALYFFNLGNQIQCLKILQYIWENSDFINTNLLIFISVLTQEFCIRYNNFTLANKTINFMSKNFSSDQAVANFLKNKFSNANVMKNIVETAQINTNRLKLALSIHENSSSSSISISDTLRKVDKSLDPSKKKNATLPQILSLSGAALYQHDTKKGEAILSLAHEQQDCAVLNNRGVLEFEQKRYSSALLLFSKALSTSKKDKIVHPYQCIIYNIGLSHLQKQKPKKAFRYFYSIIQSIPYFPYLWLRLAECCVLFFKQRVAKLRRRTQQSSVIARVLSTSTKKFTILPISDSKLFSQHLKQGNNIDSHLTLEFGEKCVKNAISLMDSDDPQSEQKLAAILLYEYICLELGDWQMALQISHSIPSQTVKSQIKCLAIIYASQAHYMLHNYQEACQILKLCFLEMQFVKSSESALTLYQTAWRVFQANADLERSITYMTKSLEYDSGCREVILTQVADDLRNKKFDEALKRLKKFIPKEE